MGADSKIPYALKKTTTIHGSWEKKNQWKLNSTEIAQLTKIDFCSWRKSFVLCQIHCTFFRVVCGWSWFRFVFCLVSFEKKFQINFRGFCLLWNNCLHGEYIAMRGTEFVNQCGLYRYFCSSSKDWLLFENNMNGRIPQYCRNFILLNQIFRYDFFTNFWCNQCDGINKYSLLIAMSTTRKFVHSILAAT